MGKHWVKALKTIRRMEEDGLWHVYHPGDGLQVHNQELNYLLSNKMAERYGRYPQELLPLMSDSAIVVTGGDVERARQFLNPITTTVYDGAPHFPKEHLTVLWWDARLPLRLDLLPLGFHRVLAGWQIATPLWRYNTLARDIGAVQARQRTEEVIRDLRVPVFETGLIYARRDEDTEKLLELWLAARETGDDDKLCFMRALYQVKPLNCALPVSWVSNGRGR